MSAPPRPWSPLRNRLWYVLQDYRYCKMVGLRATATHRRRALELIALIKAGG